MPTIDRTLRMSAVAVLLPLLVTASNAFASPGQPAIAQQAGNFGDPDSGGEIRLHPHFSDARRAHLVLAGNGDVVVIGPGGGRPSARPNVIKAALAEGFDGPPIIRGPKPPRRAILAKATLAEDGPIVRGPGGTKPSARPGIVTLAIGGNDGGPVGGPGGSGKPPIRLHVFGSAKSA